MGKQPTPNAERKPTIINETNSNQLDFEGSTNLKRATFDPTKGEVEVEFRNGGVYRYGNFTPQQLGEWLNAESAGKWFADNMKDTKERASLFPLVSSKPADKTTATGTPAKGTPPGVPSPPTSKLPLDATESLARSKTSHIAGAADPGPDGPLAADAPSEPTANPALRTDYDKVDPQVRVAARAAYEAYAANCNGLTFDGRPMPKWDGVNHPVKSHWCAAITEVTNPLAAQLTDANERARQLSDRVSFLDEDLKGAKGLLAKNPDKFRADSLEAEVAKMKADPAIARNALLEGEIDVLRAKVAELEAELRKKSAQLAALEAP